MKNVMVKSVIEQGGSLGAYPGSLPRCFTVR